MLWYVRFVRSLGEVAQFVSSVSAVAASAMPAEDRIEVIVDEVGSVLPFVGMCITATPDSDGHSEVVCSRGYADRMTRHLGSKAFFEEWRGLKPTPHGTRLNETWDLDPLPETVRDYVVPAGFGGGVSIPLSAGANVFGGMHISTESAKDITDLGHYGLFLISPTINNLVEAVPRRSIFELLSAREREVLELISLGKSNKQIAAYLFIAPRTVATHVEHILSKLAADNRAHACALGMRLGLIPSQLPR